MASRRRAWVTRGSARARQRGELGAAGVERQAAEVAVVVQSRSKTWYSPPSRSSSPSRMSRRSELDDRGGDRGQILREVVRENRRTSRRPEADQPDAVVLALEAPAGPVNRSCVSVSGHRDEPVGEHGHTRCATRTIVVNRAIRPATSIARRYGTGCRSRRRGTHHTCGGTPIVAPSVSEQLALLPARAELARLASDPRASRTAFAPAPRSGSRAGTVDGR